MSKLSGCTVKLENNNKTYTKTTNAEGIASFNKIEAGTYTMTISKTGYKNYTKEVIIKTTDNQSMNITVVQEQNS